MWWLGRIQYCQTPIPLNTRTDDYTWRQTNRENWFTATCLRTGQTCFPGSTIHRLGPHFLRDKRYTRCMCCRRLLWWSRARDGERGGRGEYKRGERRWTGKREKCAFKREGERESRVIVAGYSVNWYLVIWRVIIVHCVVGGFIQQDYSYYLWKSSQECSRMARIRVLLHTTAATLGPSGPVVLDHLLWGVILRYLIADRMSATHSLHSYHIPP